jgi:peptidylprolyl isomerase
MSTPATRTPKRQRKKEGAQARRAAELAAIRRQQRTRRIVRIAIFSLIAAAIVVAMSVFGGNDNKSSTTASTTTTVAEDTSTTVAAPVTPLTCAAPDGSNTDLTKKPTVAVPAEPATELSCRDLVVGTGKEVKPGDTITAQYVGVAQSTGKEFGSSWDSGTGDGTKYSLAGGVIKGWMQGIPGMKVGGRRLLTIPGDLAYGPSPRGADIGPNETLVFVVDVQDTAAG